MSTRDQKLDAQTDALTAAGCSRVFTEQISGALRERPELDAALDYLRQGDTFVVWRLDRLGRSLVHLVDTVTTLDRRGIAFRSLTEQIDTSSPPGKLIFHVFAALAEFERDLIRDRAESGRAAARARGATGGRPLAVTPERLDAARMLLASGHTVTTAARAVGVGRSSLYRHLAVGSTA